MTDNNQLLIDITQNNNNQITPNSNQLTPNSNQLTLMQRNKIYNYLLDQLIKNKYIYSTSSEYYRKMNLKIVIPCLLLSSTASILSFISTSSSISPSDKDYFGLSVGIIASVSTLIQSIGSTIGFSNKNDLFEKCADDYAKLIIKVEFEMLAPNEKFQEFIDFIEDEMKKIQQSCKYFPPQFIIDSYNKNKDTISDADIEKKLDCIIIN